MVNREFSFPIRGKVFKLFANENIINVITKHEEELITPIYSIDLSKGEMSYQKLPVAVNSITLAEDNYYIGGKDKKVYRVNNDKSEVLLTCENDILNLKTFDQELFVLTADTLEVLSLKNKKTIQKLALEKASTFNISPNGNWIAVGFENGTIQAFSREDQKEWIALNNGVVHNSVVNNILFDQHELQIISTAVDKKMMMTQIRGNFETSERSSKGHDGIINALISGPDNTFFSGSQDSTVKLWSGGYTHQSPSTTKFNKPVEQLFYWKTTDKNMLAVIENNSNIRIYNLDDKNKNKPENELYTIYPIEAWVNREFNDMDTKVREKALNLISEFSDKYSLKTLAERAVMDYDTNLRLVATNLLLKIDHESTDEYISGLLKSNDKEVYLKAFEQLLSRKKIDPLEVIKRSINTNNKELGYRAIEVLGKLSKDDNQALNFLITLLNNKFIELRSSAFHILESILKKDPIKVINLGLSSKYEDIKKLALKQGYTNDLLKNRDFLRLIRKHLNDNSLEVRYTAFALSLLTQPNLAEILRAADEDIQRRLNDIDGKKAGKFKESDIKDLSESERSPLVEAMATPATDICLAGANALSIIKDQRAFGVLLQLSREQNEQVRMAVCKSFNFLGDVNAIPRLKMMLYDNAINVADAAFTALNNMLKDSPLILVEAGLNAPNNKIRLRTVSLISKLLKSEKEAVKYLERSLNDNEHIVRKEAFKTLLNIDQSNKSDIFKSRAEILRFALKSAHSDIRQEVLLELESKKKEEWVLEIITEMLNDPATEIRSESFKLLQKSDKDIKIVYQDALNSIYDDVRLESLQLLLNNKKKDEDIFALIYRSTNDKNIEIRKKAIQGLIDNKSLDLLKKALNSEYQDVRVGAAKAQASYGIKSSLEPLLEFIRSKEPDEKKEEWRSSLREAIKGLTYLADSSSYLDLKNMVIDPKGLFNKDAAEALRFIVTKDNQDDLAKLFSTANNNVKYEIGLAMAAISDQRSASEIFAKKSEKSLAAAFMLRNVFREHLYAFMDDPNAKLRNKALLLCLITDLGERPDSPEACLSGLSASNVDIRLKAALTLENYTKYDNYLKTITEVFNTNFKEKWEVKEEVFMQIAALLTKTDSRISLSVAEEFLSIIDKEKQTDFEQAWSIVTTRYEKQLEQGLKQIDKSDSKADDKSLLPLVTGTYVGILRLKDNAVRSTDRQTALSYLANIVKKAPEQSESVSTCLKVALHDTSSIVRDEAFENLKNILPEKELVSESLATEYRDITRKALDLLVVKSNKKDSEEILSEIQLSFTNGLELEANAVYAHNFGLIKAHSDALKARSNGLRYQSIMALFNLYEKNEEAKTVMHKALKSEIMDVKENAVSLLAQKQDKKAIPVLEQLLMSYDKRLIDLALNGFEMLNDKSTAEAIIARLQKEPNLASANRLINVLEELDNPDIGNQAIKLFIEQKHLRNPLFDLILFLSGYDQRFKIVDKEVILDEIEPHKLDDKLFEQLLKALCEIDEKGLLIRLIPITAYCKSKGIDNYLDTLSKFNDENIRQLALVSCAKRLVEFSVKPDTLKSALNNPDPTSKFLAAEGLALAGYDDGIQVLLTGIDMLQSLDHRQRAVLALGKLASLRALDTILNLANNNEHALQESAIEAIGNLKKSEKRNEIFDLLKKYISSDKNGLKTRALAGLRWFDTSEGWHLIRELSTSYEWMVQEKAIELLRYDTDKEEAVSYLSKLIEKDTNYNNVIKIYESLLYLYAKEPVKAYYLFLLSPLQYAVQRVKSDYFDVLKKEGKSELLLETLVKVKNPDMINKIKNIILNREDLPVKEAVELLPDANNQLIEVILQLLVRAQIPPTPFAKGGDKEDSSTVSKDANKKASTLKSEDKKNSTSAEKGTEVPPFAKGARGILPKETEKIIENLMQKKWKKFTDESNKDKYNELKVLERFIWYCGQTKIVPEIYTDILQDKKSDNKDLKIAILQALEGCKLDKDMLSILKNIAMYDESKSRILAVKLIEDNVPKEIDNIFAEIIDTPQALLQLKSKDILSGKKEDLLNAIKTGIPISVFTEKDINDLSEIIKDSKDDEQIIFTALEILGSINTEKAEKVIDDFANIKDQKKELKNFALKLKRKSENLRNKPTSNEWMEVLA